MFDSLHDRLQSALRTMRGQSKITPENIEEAIREVRKSLLEADVSLKVVKIFISQVRQKALGAEVLESIDAGQQFVKIVYDELVAILGGENVPLNMKGGPSIIMLLGLQGAGKTTAAAKLAAKLKKEGFNPLLVACDVQRPAAIMQLQTLGKKIDVPVFTLDTKDVQEIGEKSIEEAKKIGYNPVILDTAGRLQIDTDLMAELLLLDRSLEPAEKILVVDAMTGQEAVNVAETFNTQLDVTGLLLTKIDGDARGGAALSVRESVGKPVKYISTGEKIEDLEAFYPDRMASRILGMGDVLSLVEKAQSAINEKDAENVTAKLMRGEFNLQTFVEMQKMMKGLGPMGNIMKMMGIGGMLGISSKQQDEVAEKGEEMFRFYEIAINSMTKMEREKPEIIDLKRRRRIAKGSGLPDSEIVQMLKQFEEMRKVFKMMSGFMGGMMPGGGGGAPAGGGFPFPGMGGQQPPPNPFGGGGFPNFPGMPPGGGTAPPGGNPFGMPGMPPGGFPGGGQTQGGKGNSGAGAFSRRKKKHR
ncbi:MAG: signal recognition particle protein [Candidatus Obscuribacterales bacterium]|nr:signal recognition particle protein [Candidatus Obscuribacterales bacterium]